VTYLRTYQYLDRNVHWPRRVPPLVRHVENALRDLLRLENRQTRATQCFRLTVLYTDVDGQCDKLVTETVTSLPH